jgi:HD-like signal output (HDOD) protein
VSYDLSQLVSGAQIPGLPQSAVRMLDLSQDPNNGPSEYAQLIEVDPGLTAQILRFVNSSYFGFATEISNVRHAITLVGVSAIKNFTLWTAVLSVMPNSNCTAFQRSGLWRDSLLRGLFSRHTGRLLKVDDPEELFVAALLQDLALPLLVQKWPDEYSELLQFRAATGARLSSLEQDRFGWNHGDAGKLMCRQWGLPAAFGELIAGHVHFDETASSVDGRILAVGLSSLLPSAIESEWRERDRFVSAFELCVPGVTLVDTLTDVDTCFEEFGKMFGVSGKSQSLIQRFEACALA